MRFQSTVTILLMVVGVASAADLTKIDRTIKKEPAYQSKSPRYAILVFGPKAETRVWLVLDLVGEPWEEDGSKNALYIDRDGDGDLTGPGERVACTLTKKQEPITSFTRGQSFTHSPHFDCGEIVEKDGKTRHTELTLEVDSYVQRYRPVSLSIKINGQHEQFAGGQLLKFGDRPADAPIIHFNGPLTLRLSMESGVLRIPINYDEKADPKWYDEHPPVYDMRSLVRGESRDLVAQIGTPGLGRGTFAALSAGAPPADQHPVAEMEFPAADPKGNPLRLAVPLKSRCCGTLFRGEVAVSANAAAGKAKVSLSYADWKDGQIAPATGDVTVTNPVRPPGRDGTKE